MKRSTSVLANDVTVRGQRLLGGVALTLGLAACSKPSPHVNATAETLHMNAETASVARGDVVPGVQLVHVTGYGVSIALLPPFKGVRIPEPLRVVSDQLVFSHPDGARVRNLNVLPKSGSSGPPRLAASGSLFQYVIGDDGTVVVLGAGMPNADGVALVREGPGDAGWRVRVGDRLESWPDGTRLESTPSAPGYVFVPLS